MHLEKKMQIPNFLKRSSVWALDLMGSVWKLPSLSSGASWDSSVNSTVCGTPPLVQTLPLVELRPHVGLLKGVRERPALLHPSLIPALYEQEPAKGKTGWH